MAKTESTNGVASSSTEAPTTTKAVVPSNTKIEIDPQAIQLWAMTHKLKLGGVAVALALALAWYCWPRAATPPTITIPTQQAGFVMPPQQSPAVYVQPQPSPTAFSGITAAPRSTNTKLAETATISFTVAGYGNVGTSKFLNSSSNYRDPSNQSVCLTGSAAAAVDPKQLVGRKVTATGQLKRSDKTGTCYVLVNQASGVKVE